MFNQRKYSGTKMGLAKLFNFLKGLSYKIDLAFDGLHRQF
jgi:hypothetical protein